MKTWKETKEVLSKLGIQNIPDSFVYRINLSEADLSEADLRGAYLRGADLGEADLRGADLRGADLSEADLRGADLRGADLRGADLRGADLRGTVLRDKTKQLRAALRSCHQANGGVILYRTKKSKHVGDTVYEVGHTYTAPAFSLCPVTDCHPGIYGMTLEQIRAQYPNDRLVRIYVPYGEWHFVSEEKGFRCRRVRVLQDMP